MTFIVKALNVIIGQIGGYTALVWLLIMSLFDNYESFKFQNSLIGRIYACTPLGPNAPVSTNEKESMSMLTETLTTHS